ncbi:MAG: ATP-binding cassette domain-containing protein, partial [Actinomycetales bacterium]
MADRAERLTAMGVCVYFEGVKAVDEVDLVVNKGRISGLIGPNGAGKSTTFNMVNGQLRADRGSVLLEGTELIGLQPR